MLDHLTLIGYQLEQRKADTQDETIITFAAIGSHENFYRDLKK
jgi:hypothetical protein